MSWSQFRPVPDSARICPKWDRNGSTPGFSVVTNLVSISNRAVIPIWLLFAVKKKCMRGKHFDEIRPMRNVCHQCYVRADKSGTAHARYAFSRIWDRPNLGHSHRQYVAICWRHNQNCTRYLRQALPIILITFTAARHNCPHRANNTAYLWLYNDFLLGFCHKDNFLKSEFKQNIQRKERVPAAILLTA